MFEARFERHGVGCVESMDAHKTVTLDPYLQGTGWQRTTAAGRSVHSTSDARVRHRRKIKPKRTNAVYLKGKQLHKG